MGNSVNVPQCGASLIKCDPNHGVIKAWCWGLLFMSTEQLLGYGVKWGQKPFSSTAQVADTRPEGRIRPSTLFYLALHLVTTRRQL